MTKEKPRFGLVILLAACAAAGPLSITMYTPSMPAISAGLGATLSQVQHTFSLFLLGFGTALLLFGPLSDRFGRRPILLAGMTLYILAGLACAQATGIFELQIARFFQGAAASSGPLIARTVVRDRFQGADVVRAFSFITITMALSPILGPLIGGELQVRFGWPAVFYSLAGFGFFLLVLCGVFLRESNTNPIAALSVRRLAKNYSALLRSPSYRSAILAIGFTFAGFFSFHNFIPFLLVEKLGVRPDHFGLLAALVAPFFAVGGFLAGRLARRFPVRNLVLTGMLLSLPSGVLLVFVSGELSIARIMVPMMIFVLGFGFTIPPAMTMALAPFPNAAGSASSVLGFVQMGSAGLIGLVTGPLYDGTTAPLGWIVLGCAGAALLAILPVCISNSGEAGPGGCRT